MAATSPTRSRTPWKHFRGRADAPDAGPEGTSQADLLQIIQDESKRLTTILDNFLRYVKPHPLEKGALDVGALVQDVVTLFRNAPECSDGVELVVDLPGGAVVIHADSGRIRQALWNLLQNARKAIPTEGRSTFP